MYGTNKIKHSFSSKKKKNRMNTFCQKKKKENKHNI